MIASAPSIQMITDLLSDLADAVQELSTDYELLQERVQDGAEIDESDLQVSSLVRGVTRRRSTRERGSQSWSDWMLT
jgi:hypothetical protein